MTHAYLQTTTQFGEHFLLPERILTHLAAVDIIYGAGTCYACPRILHFTPWLQLTVNITTGTNVTVYFQPRANLYTQVFWLYSKMYHQLQLQPSTIFLDYQVAIRNTAYSVFPCRHQREKLFFHFTQCICRKIQETGIHVSWTTTSINKYLVPLSFHVYLLLRSKMCDLMLLPS